MRPTAKPALASASAKRGQMAMAVEAPHLDDDARGGAPSRHVQHMRGETARHDALTIPWRASG